MKLKFKPTRRQLTVAAVLVLIVVALLVSRSSKDDVAGPGPLDAAATRACDDFAAGHRKATSTSSRLALADRVMESSVQTENELISQRAAEMGRSANDSDADWRTSSAALTDACEGAGWQES